MATATVKVTLNGFTVEKTDTYPNLGERYALINVLMDVVDAINVAHGVPYEKEQDLRKILKEKLK